MSATQKAIVVREVQNLSEMMGVEQLQKEVWGVEDREILPALAMIPMREVGAVLLGAFEGVELIGFSFAFPGFENGQPILHSDMLAVKPAYRSLGLGLQLKLAQRTHALEKGIDTITWTFDPLQALNANLNFAKLGVVSDRYLVNYYGETTSFLHSTGTDRLWVTWKLNSKWVTDRINGQTAEFDESIPNILKVGDTLEPIALDLRDSHSLSIDVPIDFNSIVKDNRDLAISWREAARKAFRNALADGFIVQDFRLNKSEQPRFGRYLLARGT
jgi:predicted GNAT superfamily acetyltransferase